LLLWISAVANAQTAAELSNDAYRRAYQEGYQHGFRDGMAQAAKATEEQRSGPRPLACRRIVVLAARYGTSDRQCDATRAIGEQANGRGSATLRAANTLCGDPSPGKGKELAVDYGCGHPEFCGREIHSASAYENKSLTLSCQP
jgi:hypothetical protein